MAYSPKFPYDKNQALLNSDRVVINSKEDSIFLFSNKVISLSSNEGIHFNTDKEFYVNSSEIKLGLEANEPLVKGNQLKNILNKLLGDLNNIGNLLSTATDSNGVSISAVVTAGNSLQRSTNRIKTLLKNLNSESNFTI
jgi:hypothetical protein